MLTGILDEGRKPTPEHACDGQLRTFNIKSYNREEVALLVPVLAAGPGLARDLARRFKAGAWRDGYGAK